MDRWINATATRDFLALEERVLGLGSERRIVSTVRGWADALLAARALDRHLDGPSPQVGSYVVSETNSDSGPRLLVAAERCAVAQLGGLGPLLRGTAWREAKRFLVDQGWRQDVVEEAVTPTTTEGMQGRVDPELVFGWLEEIDVSLREALVRFFAPDLDAYIDSWSELNRFSDEEALPTDIEIIVPWDGVVAVRDESGMDHVRA